MKTHELYQLAMPRGAAGRVARELGYADASVPKRWRRPLAAASNLFTGELSQLMKAKAEILAHDRVDESAADVLLFDLFAAVARQRSRRKVDSDEDAVLVALVNGYHEAIESFLIEAAPLLTEQQLYRAGANVVRALLFVIDDDGAGLPLMKVDTAAAPRGERVGVGARLLALLGRRRG